MNDNSNNDAIAKLGAVAVQLCTVNEACALLRVSRWQVYQLINERELRTVKIGRRRLVPLAELRSFIARRQADEVFA